MKIKLFKTFAVGLVVAIVALTQYGCEQDWQKDFESSVLKAPASVELAVSSIKDSTAVVTYTQSAVGQLYIVVVPGDDETPAPAENTILRLTTENAVFTKQFFLDEETTGTVNIGGLEQNTSYKVFALPVNTDGVFGAVGTTPAFTTSDEYDPVFVSSSPAASGTADKPADFKVTVTFDEPVMFGDKEEIFFTYRNPFTGVLEAKPAEVTIDGKSLVAVQTHIPIAGQYVFLNIGADAITDRSDNPFEGIESGVIGGFLEGLFWRAEYIAEKVDTVLPNVNEPVQDLDFTFEITYGKPMSFYPASAGGYDSKDVIVRYSSAGTTIDVETPAANISFADEVVTITPPRTPVYGETVTFHIAEGAYRTGYGSPCEETAFDDHSWLVSYGYTRDLIIGSYVANCVSSFDASEYNFNVTIAVDPGSDDGVLITGLENSTEAIEGTFNGDFATLTIESNQSLGDLEGNGNSVVLISDWAGAEVDFIGSIGADGTITISWGSYIVGGPYNNYFWDRYTDSVWSMSKGNAVNYVERQFKPIMKIK